MQATLKIGRAGQIVIPTTTREAMGLKTGDIIVVDILGKASRIAEQETNQGNPEGLPSIA